MTKHHMMTVILCCFLLASRLDTASPWHPSFRNIAATAGLTAPFPNGGDTSKEFIVETTGSGVAIFDYDNDGLPDIFIVSGPGGTNRLYHNDGHDHFRDVTHEVGLESDGWGQGVCVGDFDNDGFTDLFVTYYGQNRLYRNVGGKRFEDVTEQAHLLQDRTRYNTGCAFVDIDNDGYLDLFVANYLRFDFATAPRPNPDDYCSYRDLSVACGPRGLPLDRNILYHNNRDGTFSDITQESGIAVREGHYSLGVVVSDFNNDGLPDIYVACDQTPSLLYINQGNGKFKEEAMERGAALGESGQTLSGMGVDAADYDGSGNFSIFQSNFSDQLEALYRNRGNGEFENVALAAGLGVNTTFVGWGAGFLDYDNDGWPDLLLVNSHVYPEVDQLHADIHYKERVILYHNQGNGTFSDVSKASGPGILERHAARGAAFGDIDNDGSVEVVINNQNEPPTLLKLAKSPPGHWIILRLEGTRSNRSAIGARVRITAGAHSQTGEVRSGGSYLSQNDLRLHFGLGNQAMVQRIDVRWPSGRLQTLTNVSADRIMAIREPSEEASFPN